MMITDIKDILFGICLEKNANRLNEVNYAITQSQDAIENDTKSSAGDKYETTREMIQQDLNRYQNQLQQAKADQHILEQIDLSTKSKVALGAVVQTDLAIYFIAISIGRVDVDGDTYMIVSPSSPIGALLIAKEVNDIINFNGKMQRVLQVI